MCNMMQFKVLGIKIPNLLHGVLLNTLIKYQCLLHTERFIAVMVWQKEITLGDNDTALPQKDLPNISLKISQYSKHHTQKTRHYWGSLLSSSTLNSLLSVWLTA